MIYISVTYLSRNDYVLSQNPIAATSKRALHHTAIDIPEQMFDVEVWANFVANFPLRDFIANFGYALADFCKFLNNLLG